MRISRLLSNSGSLRYNISVGVAFPPGGAEVVPEVANKVFSAPTAGPLW